MIDSERTEISANVVEHGRIRDFFGFNRAKHAVIEAAILATRVQFLSASVVQSEFDRLSVIVEKTGGHQERSAFAFLQAHIVGQCRATPRSGDGRGMTAAVHVQAPCRLHFGMFSFGHADRAEFGGVGVMIEPPNVQVAISAADSFSVCEFAG